MWNFYEFLWLHILLLWWKYWWCWWRIGGGGERKWDRRYFSKGPSFFKIERQPLLVHESCFWRGLNTISEVGKPRDDCITGFSRFMTDTLVNWRGHWCKEEEAGHRAWSGTTSKLRGSSSHKLWWEAWLKKKYNVLFFCDN